MPDPVINQYQNEEGYPLDPELLTGLARTYQAQDRGFVYDKIFLPINTQAFARLSVLIGDTLSTLTGMRLSKTTTLILLRKTMRWAVTLSQKTSLSLYLVKEFMMLSGMPTRFL